jgi:hypothetical protein
MVMMMQTIHCYLRLDRLKKGQLSNLLNDFPSFIYRLGCNIIIYIPFKFSPYIAIYTVALLYYRIRKHHVQLDDEETSHNRTP